MHLPGHHSYSARRSLLWPYCSRITVSDCSAHLTCAHIGYRKYGVTVLSDGQNVADWSCTALSAVIMKAFCQPQHLCLKVPVPCAQNSYRQHSCTVIGKRSLDAVTPAVPQLPGLPCCCQQVCEVPGAVRGELPAWLCGSLLVNGGGDYSHMNHMFDGYALVTKVRLSGGKAWGSQRYLDTKVYRAYKKEGEWLAQQQPASSRPQPHVAPWGGCTLHAAGL